MWFYTRNRILPYLFLFTYSLESQKLMLRIEHRERTDKHTKLNEINIRFINKTDAEDERAEKEDAGTNYTVITSQIHRNYANGIEAKKINAPIEYNKEQTLRGTPTYVLHPLEFINKQFEPRTYEYTNNCDAANKCQEDSVKIIATNKQDEAKTNYDYSLRALEDYSNTNINKIPAKQNMGDAGRIKNNLETFVMNRKEKYIATPKFDFPVRNIDKMHFNFNKNKHLSFNETNYRNDRLRKIPNMNGFPTLNYDETYFHNKQNNYLSKRRPISENSYRRKFSIQNYNDTHNQNDAKGRIYENTQNLTNYLSKENNNLRKEVLNDKNNKRTVEKSNVKFPISKYNKINLYNKNYRLKNRHYVNNYGYRINKNRNEFDSFNDETNNNYKFLNTTYDVTNFYNKENNHNMNKKHNYNVYNSTINKNYNNIDNYNDKLRENYEKSQMLDILNKQNKLIEKIANGLLKDRIKRERDEKTESWTEFDDIVKSLEMRHNRTSSYTRPSTTTSKLTTIMTLIDETEVRKALQKDPFVKRILKMASRKGTEYENQLG